MATFTFSGRSVALLLLLLAFVASNMSLTNASAAPNADYIKSTDNSKLIFDICSKTRNSGLCMDVLKPYVNLDLLQLGQISIQMTRSNGTATSNIIASLSEKSSDPKIKAQYSKCLEKYEDAITHLDDCKKFVSDKDNMLLNSNANVARSDSEACGDELASNAPPQLTQANLDFQDLVGIIVSLSGFL